MVCVNTGYQWIADETFFKPWVTTGGQVVYQLERMRVYGKDDIIPEDANNSCVDKLWLTNGLTGVSLIVKENYDIQHEEGSFVYIDNDDSVILHGFMGATGDKDNNIESLLDKICRISGTQATFPGDTTIASSTLGSGESVIV
jgi:hypothetical protein